MPGAETASDRPLYCSGCSREIKPEEEVTVVIKGDAEVVEDYSGTGDSATVSPYNRESGVIPSMLDTLCPNCESKRGR